MAAGATLDESREKRSSTARLSRRNLPVAKGKIPVIFPVDAEPDGLFIDRSKATPWEGYEGAFAFFQSVRRRMAAATGAPVHLSWFFRMDPQIAETYGRADWAAARYAAYLPWYADNGDEIGLHAHAYRWIREHGRWSLDHANQDWPTTAYARPLPLSATHSDATAPRSASVTAG